MKPDIAKKVRQSQSPVNHILQCEGYCIQQVLSTGPDDQSASLEEDPAVYALLSAQKETRVVAGQIIVALPQQCTYLQYPEHQAIPVREEHHCTETTSLFT